MNGAARRQPCAGGAQLLGVGCCARPDQLLLTSSLRICAARTVMRRASRRLIRLSLILHTRHRRAHRSRGAPPSSTVDASDSEEEEELLPSNPSPPTAAPARPHVSAAAQVQTPAPCASPSPPGGADPSPGAAGRSRASAALSAPFGPRPRGPATAHPPLSRMCNAAPTAAAPVAAARAATGQAGRAGASGDAGTQGRGGAGARGRRLDCLFDVGRVLVG
jgi:hypothetical protein